MNPPLSGNIFHKYSVRKNDTQSQQQIKLIIDASK